MQTFQPTGMIALAIVAIAGLAAPLAAAPRMPSLEGAVAWINSEPLRREQLAGKVVLVQFWTYTCINWRRTMPYVRAWSSKYQQNGLVVIGVHTPEFAFEADVAHVREATAEIGIHFPIAVDSNYAIWRAFDNAYWPAMYFIDARGRIRHAQFGEGDYDTAERTLQQLLSEAGKAPFDSSLVKVTGNGAETAPDWTNLRSEETYLGYERAERFASQGKVQHNAALSYAVPNALGADQWALGGRWTWRADRVVVEERGARIVLRFYARDVHLVMGAGTRAQVRFRVRLDGRAPGAEHGADVDADGSGVVREPRMYQLLRQSAPIEPRQIEIEFLDAGAELFDFTFG